MANTWSDWVSENGERVEEVQRGKTLPGEEEEVEFTIGEETDEMPDGRQQTFVIDEISCSLNEWYSGNSHWSNRVRQKNRWVRLVEKAASGLFPVASYPVSLEVVCTFGHGSRSYDASNLAATVKLCEDALCKAGILKDDSRKYVKAITMISKKDHGEDRTRITITETKE